MAGDTASTAAEPARRAYGRALALVGVGAVGLLLAYGMTWGSATVPLVAGAEGTGAVRAFTGRDLFPAAAAMGWVCLAGVAGVLATRSWGRVLVALAILVAGIGGAAGAIAFAVNPSAAIDGAADSPLGSAAAASTSTTAWWLLAVAGGVVAVLAAAWTVARGRTWPSMGARYERAARGRTPRDAWDAQDLGQDPTDDLVTGPDPDAETGSSA